MLSVFVFLFVFGCIVGVAYIWWPLAEIAFGIAKFMFFVVTAPILLLICFVGGRRVARSRRD